MRIRDLKCSSKDLGFLWSYIFMCVAAVLIINKPEILASNDLAAYLAVFKLSAQGGDSSEIIVATEPLLPWLYFAISTFFDVETVGELAEVNILLFLLVFYFALRALRVSVVLVALVFFFLDYALTVHLYRQALSSVFLFISLVIYSDKRINLGSALLFLISVALHNTALIFYLLGIFAVHSSGGRIKVIILIGIMTSWILNIQQFSSLLNMTMGIPVLGKAYYAVVALNAGHDAGIRTVSIFAAWLMLLINLNEPGLKVIAVFIALGLAFSGLPIIGPRVGLLGTSIFTGYVYFEFFRQIGAKFLSREIAFKRTRTHTVS